jgi:hypothetical protein
MERPRSGRDFKLPKPVLAMPFAGFESLTQAGSRRLAFTKRLKGGSRRPKRRCAKHKRASTNYPASELVQVRTLGSLFQHEVPNATLPSKKSVTSIISSLGTDVILVEHSILERAWVMRFWTISRQLH